MILLLTGIVINSICCFRLIQCYLPSITSSDSLIVVGLGFISEVIFHYFNDLTFSKYALAEERETETMLY